MSERRVIHFAIGTKAQLIKTAPVMKRLAERGLAYRYIDLGQHANLTAQLRSTFKLKEPDIALADSRSGNVKTLKEASRWMYRLLQKTFRRRHETYQNVFAGRPGVCVIHGDTISTLLGLVLARRAGLKILHLEAGLRSHNLLHPFPEELLRLICMKYSDHLAAPNAWAYENLQEMGYASKAFLTHGNTGADMVGDILAGLPDPDPREKPFALVSIHRFETIMSRRRLQLLIELVTECAAQINLRFVMHEPTERALRRFKLMPVLHQHGIKLFTTQNYPDFLQLIRCAQFVITDGGSVQEECAALGKPCLVYRKHTERQEGLGENVCLSKLEPARFREFVRNYQSYQRPAAFIKKRPSDLIVDFLVSAGYANT